MDRRAILFILACSIVITHSFASRADGALSLSSAVVLSHVHQIESSLETDRIPTPVILDLDCKPEIIPRRPHGDVEQRYGL